MTDPNDKFLFFAYSLVWIVFVLYVWSIARRQSRLSSEVEELKKKQSFKEQAPVPKA